ncbi:hypothetical protein [Lactovum miscens]|uniref:Uncharacterized protein n=1 Tax=Lactovum miscens TaxID=190387 RepID=A0A841CAP7_9LACT|nr:hypothetical protein [Lactovum miscens]MBB5888260.1 hypothetical protein [Lactovum miscens]
MEKTLKIDINKKKFIKKTQSFTKYISQQFYNELFKASQDDVDSRKDFERTLYDMEVKSVRINEEVGMSICFDIIVEAT